MPAGDSLGGDVVLLTRTGLDWTAKYPDVAAALSGLKRRQGYLDGELCAVDADGATSFAGLQGHGQTQAHLVFFAFDPLHLDGDVVVRRSLLDRKDTLAPGHRSTSARRGRPSGEETAEDGSKVYVRLTAPRRRDADLQLFAAC